MVKICYKTFYGSIHDTEEDAKKAEEKYYNEVDEFRKIINETFKPIEYSGHFWDNFAIVLYKHRGQIQDIINNFPFSYPAIRK